MSFFIIGTVIDGGDIQGEMGKHVVESTTVNELVDVSQTNKSTSIISLNS